MAYSVDFRLRAINFVDVGHSEEELYEVFGVYMSAVKRWRKQLRETGSLKPNYPKTRASKIDIQELEKAVEEKPSAYLHELGVKFGCTKQAIFYALKRAGITYKKKHLPTLKNRGEND